MTEFITPKDAQIEAAPAIIPILRIRGEISFQSPHMQDLFNILPQLETQEHTGLIVTLDTTGGTVATAQSIISWIKRLYMDLGKPTIAVVEEHCLSSGLMIGVACDRFIAPPGAQLGAFGTMLSWPDSSELRGKIGLRQHTFKSAPLKDMCTPIRPPNADDEAGIMDLLNDLDEQFKSFLISSKPKLAKNFDALKTGATITGRRAFTIGLIDEMGGLERALDCLPIDCSDGISLSFLGNPQPNKETQNQSLLHQLSNLFS